MPAVDQSVLAGHSPYMANTQKKDELKGPFYEPLEDGGFRIAGGKAKAEPAHRPWPEPRLDRRRAHLPHGHRHGQRQLRQRRSACSRSGRGPTPRSATSTRAWARCGSACRPPAKRGGSTRSPAPRPSSARATPTINSRRRLEGKPLDGADAGLPRAGLPGGVRSRHAAGLAVWQHLVAGAENNDNRVRSTARNADHRAESAAAAWYWPVGTAGHRRAVAAAYGRQAEFSASEPRRVYHIVAAWGVTRYERPRAGRRSPGWTPQTPPHGPPVARRVEETWFDCTSGRPWSRKSIFAICSPRPSEQLRRTRAGGMRGGRSSRFTLPSRISMG